MRSLRAALERNAFDSELHRSSFDESVRMTTIAAGEDEQT